MEPRSPFDDHIRPPDNPPAPPPRWPDPVPHAPAMSVRSPHARRRGLGRFSRSAIIGAAVVAVIAAGVHYLAQTSRQPPVNVTTVVHRVNPGIVDVNSNLGFNQGGAAGTGMVVTSSGEVLTNNHVVDGATSVQVVDIGNGRTYTATVVGTDRTEDVAVLQIQGASNLSTVNLGTVAGLSVGDAVAAFGNAGGVGGTPSVASGHVTGLGQSITAFDDVTQTSESLTGLIQTDAAIQPGDSGGPLVNSVGTVVGMDTAASSGSRGHAGPATNGFAIPIDRALAIAQQIERGTSSGTVHIGPVAFIGIQIASGQNSRTPGIVIGDVIPGEPADTIGLQAGDVVTSIAGVAVTNPTQLTLEMQHLHPGQSVPLSWTDTGGQAHTAPITLASGPAA
jgi:S1-C subfamily serine protease